MRTTVGPLPPEVYWRRRLVGVVLLVVALVVLRSCVGGDTSRAGRSPQATSTHLAAPTASATPDGSAGHPYLPLSSAPSPSATPTSSALPSALPSGSPSAAKAAVIGTCPDSSLQLTAAMDGRAFKVGFKPRLSMTVRNVGAVPCRRDLGSTARELLITSGAAHTWSSADCQPAGTPAVVLLDAGTAQTYATTWTGQRSTANCSAPPVVATAGTYRLQVRLGTLRSGGYVFRLT